MDVRISLWALVTVWLLTCQLVHAQTIENPRADAAVLTSPAQTVDTTAETRPQTDTQPKADWAAELLANDPLAGKELVTLEDLQLALQDEQQRNYVIERHFSRATLTPEQQRDFLLEAFQHSNLIVRQQAAAALQDIGELREAIRQQLLEWIETRDNIDAEAAIVGLQFLQIPNENVDRSLLSSLLQALASNSTKVRDAAARQLKRLGPAAIPILLEAMQDPEQPQLEAAEVLSEILRASPTAMPEPAREVAPSPPVPPEPDVPVITKSVTRATTDQDLQRKVKMDDAELVRVYFGTNRVISINSPDPKQSLAIWAAVFLVALLLTIRLINKPRKNESSWLGSAVRRVVGAVVCIGAMVWSGMHCNAAVQTWMSDRQGVEFGGRRSANSTIHYGYCDVSIPPTHAVGAVERPLIGAEDEAKHVVLQRAALLEQAEFYAAINGVLDDLGDTSRDCLLYVHGYNVAFDDAAQRTAQIHYDLKFDGMTMFYSWPSRASVRHYFSDRNEIRFSHHLIKNFLAGVLTNVDVDRFHIVAHSMGADALCQAILELDPEGRVFDQIILAAPDIDADVFKQQILPRLQQCGNRTTLYCSQNDLALHASKHFNDSLRAGDSSNGPLVAAGLDTIDASQMDTELLGHSYYGNCLRLLDDLRLLLEQNRPPEQRRLEPLFGVPEIPYWIFIE